jgi:hypothetical protein
MNEDVQEPGETNPWVISRSGIRRDGEKYCFFCHASYPRHTEDCLYLTWSGEEQKYVGICPSSAGIHPAEQIEVTAKSIAEARKQIWAKIGGSRYIARIKRVSDGATVWEEV